MKAYLVDGTYELFRHYFGAPPHRTAAGEQVGATRAVLGSLLGMLEDGATHMAVATDHVIESWRNEAWPTYKSSAGVAEDLLSQFPLLEEALAAMGLVVWPMTELEADDALASGAAVLADDERLSQVLICTPDKDLGQCVQGREGGLPGQAQRRHRRRGRGAGALRRRPPRPCRTGWPWSGTARTATRGWPVGGPKRRAPCWAVTARSRLSRPPRRPGTSPPCRRPAPCLWPPR